VVRKGDGGVALGAILRDTWERIVVYIVTTFFIRKILTVLTTTLAPPLHRKQQQKRSNQSTACGHASKGVAEDFHVDVHRGESWSKVAGLPGQKDTRIFGM
jgi:hypothetical protein